MTLSEQTHQRLIAERNMWFTTVRADGRPHMVPLWFVWFEEKLYFCVQPDSVKVRNLVQNPNVVVSLEDGSSVVICEGTAADLPKPWADGIRDGFQTKYDWDITTENTYTLLIEVKPKKWLVW